MANESLDQLLLGFDIDLSPLKQKAVDANKIIDALEARWLTTGQKAAKDAKNVAQQNVADHKKVVEAVKETGTAAKSASSIAQDALKQQKAAQQANTAAIRDEILASQAKKAAIAAETEETIRQTREIAKQTALLRKRRLEEISGHGEPKEKKEKEERGATSTLLGGVIKGALGEGLSGEIAGGIVAGEGISKVIEGLSGGIQHLVEHMRELSVETGSITQLNTVFGNLAVATGTTADAMTNHLRHATEGLIDDFTLMKLSTTALMSSFKMSLPVLEEFAHDVVTVAEASGKSAAGAINALQRAFTRGRPQMLSMALGMQSFATATKMIPPVVQGAARASAEWAIIMEKVHKRAEAFGELPPTLEKAATQFATFKKNLDFAFGVGFNQSSGIKSISEAMDHLNEHYVKLAEGSKMLGDALGRLIGGFIGIADKIAGLASNVPVAVTGFTLFAGGIAVVSKVLVDAAIAMGRFASAQAAAIIPTSVETKEIVAQEVALTGEALAAKAAAGATEQLAVAETAAGAEKAVVATETAALTTATVAEGAATKSAGVATLFLGTALNGLKAAFASTAVAMVPVAVALAGIGYGLKKTHDEAQQFVDKDVLVTWADALKGMLLSIKDVWGNVWKEIKEDTSNFAALLSGQISPLEYAQKFLNRKDPHGEHGENYAPQEAAKVANQRTAQQKAQLVKDTEELKHASEVEEEVGKRLEIAKKRVMDATRQGKAHPHDATVLARSKAANDEWDKLDLEHEKAKGDVARAKAKVPETDAEHAANILKMREEANQPDEGASYHQMAQMARSKMQRDIAANKESLAIKKSGLEKEREMEEMYYSLGETTLAQHQAKLLDIARRENEYKVEEISLNLQEKIASINKQRGITMLPQVADDEIAAARAGAHTEVIAEQNRFDTTMQKLRTQAALDARDAQIKEYEGELQRTEASIKAKQSLLQQNLGAGTVSPSGYVTESIALIQQQAQAEIAQANRVAEIKKNSATALQERANAIDKAVLSATDKAAALQAKLSEIEIQFIEKTYGDQQKGIKDTLDFVKDYGTRFDIGHTKGELQQAAIGSLEEQLKAYYAEFTKLNNDPSTQFGDQWQKVSANTQIAFKELQNYKDELAQTVALTTPLGSVFTTLGKGVEGSFGNAKVKDVGAKIAGAGGVFSKIAENRQKIADMGKPKKLPPEVQQMVDLSVQLKTAIKSSTDPLISSTETVSNQFKALSAAMDTFKASLNPASKPAPSVTAADAPGASKQFTTPGPGMFGPAAPLALQMPGIPNIEQTVPGATNVTTPDREQLDVPMYHETGTVQAPDAAADKLTKFAAKLSMAVDGITSFIGAMTSAKSAVGGAVGGAAGGFGLGDMAKTATKDGQMGGMLQGLSGQMPMIGAALGVVMGGIMGEKNAMVQRNLDALHKEYQAMGEAYSSGNATMQQTITTLQGLIRQAQDDMANSKKGSQQFRDLINQYNEEMKKYLDQAAQLMRQLENLNSQAALPNYGQDFSSYVSSLEGVIKQYEQFAGAAKTSTEQMAAQTYLQQALANQTQQWTEQLNTDGITAVQDAIQLNDLIRSRNQLLQETAQNQRNIMQQGVLTRQQTFAQSKAEKLAQSQYQANLQLQQMNEQIALQTSKVDAEKRVFDLATTRIGLEAQLLTMQEAQSNRQVAGIQALANLVALMNKGVSSNNAPTEAANDFIKQLLAALAAQGNTSSGNIAGLLATYQQYASSGMGAGALHP